jgi:hypothetical protein
MNQPAQLTSTTQPNITILSIHQINNSLNVLLFDPVSHVETLINQSMSLSYQDCLYALSHVQQLILNTFPLIHLESDTKRLIILYRFCESIIDHASCG